MMARLSISKAWDETKAVFAHDRRLIVAVALALIVLPQTVFGAFVPPAMRQVSAVAQIGAFVVVLIGLVAQLSLNRLAIGPSTTVGHAIGRGAQRLAPVVIAFVLIILAMTVLFIPVAILLVSLGVMADPVVGGLPSPGFMFLLLLTFTLVFAIFQLMLPVAAAEDAGPLRLIRRSWDLGRHSYLRLLAFFVIVMIGVIVVWLAGQFLAGIFTSLLFGPPDAGTLSAALLALAIALIQAGFTVLSAVMLARIYVQLAGAGEGRASVPISGT